MGIIRTTFVVGEDLKILKVIEKVKTKDHANQILQDWDYLYPNSFLLLIRSVTSDGNLFSQPFFPFLISVKTSAE